jgi:hypothetical protein
LPTQLTFFQGGAAAERIDHPAIDRDLITPISEAFQAVVWHCLVSLPMLKVNKTKW